MTDDEIIALKAALDKLSPLELLEAAMIVNPAGYIELMDQLMDDHDPRSNHC